MTHFEMELSEHGLILLISILGVLFWMAVISLIALVMVMDRLIEEVINGEDDDVREYRDEQGDPEERA
jgi:type III secretory pathway component EscU